MIKDTALNRAEAVERSLERVREALTDAVALLKEAEKGFSRVLVGTSDHERVYGWVGRVGQFLRALAAQPPTQQQRNGD